VAKSGGGSGDGGAAVIEAPSGEDGEGSLIFKVDAYTYLSDWPDIGEYIYWSLWKNGQQLVYRQNCVYCPIMEFEYNEGDTFSYKLEVVNNVEKWKWEGFIGFLTCFVLAETSNYSERYWSYIPSMIGESMEGDIIPPQNGCTLVVGLLVD